ncbi:MAG: site-specific integrase [Peptococcaceae bacterium]|nr:site-specific integrase [Peptococcaceae bacterium]
MSVQKRGKDSWLIDIYIGDQGGKRYRETVHGTKKEARAREAELVTKFAAGYSEPTKMTVGDFMHRWEEKYLSKRKATTQMTYKYELKKIKGHHICNVRLDKLNKMVLQDFFDSLRSPAGAKKVLSVILKRAALEEVIAASRVIDLFSGLEIRKPVVRKTGTMVPEEIDTFLLHAKDDRYFNIYKLMLNAGLRISEVLALTWADVDLVRRKLSVNKNRSDTTKTPSSTREIDLDDDLVAIFRDQRKKVLQEAMKAKVWEDNNLVFPNTKGRHSHYSTVLRHIDKILLSAGVSLTGTHLLRHTFGSVLIDNGVPIPAVSKILGHANPGLTARVYAHPMPGSLKAAIEIMSKIINRRPKKSPHISKQEEINRME